LRNPDFRVLQGAPDRGPGPGAGSRAGPRTGVRVPGWALARSWGSGRAPGPGSGTGDGGRGPAPRASPGGPIGGVGSAWAQLGSIGRKRPFLAKKGFEMRFFKSQRFGKTPSGSRWRCFSVVVLVIDLAPIRTRAGYPSPMRDQEKSQFRTSVAKRRDPANAVKRMPGTPLPYPR